MSSPASGIKLFILKVLRKTGILGMLDLKLHLKLAGRQFHVPIIRETGFNNHCMDEFWMLDIFRALKVKDRDVLIDIGANVGQTLLKWKAVNRKAAYVGIEPLHECVAYLSELITRNNFVDCQIVPAALALKDGNAELNLHFDDLTDRTASLQKSDMSVLKKQKVKTISFESLLKSLEFESSDIACIKIDSEGSELIILQAMAPFIMRHRPIIVVEVLDDAQQGDVRLNEINRIIHGADYSIFRVVKKDMKLVSLMPIDYIRSPFGIDESDYVLMPEEAKKKVHPEGTP